MKVRTSLELEQEQMTKIRANGWTLKELVQLGILAKEGNPALIERIGALERDYKAIFDLVRGLRVKTHYLETKIKGDVFGRD